MPVNFTQLLGHCKLDTSSTALIYKDECVFSFATPFSQPHGLFISLRSHIGVGAAYLDRYHALSGDQLFLNLCLEKVMLNNFDTNDLLNQQNPDNATQQQQSAGGTAKPAALIPPHEQYELRERVALFVMPSKERIDLEIKDQKVTPSAAYPDIPTKLLECVERILAAESAAKREERIRLEGRWDPSQGTQVPLAESVHARNLVQLQNGVRISANPAKWKCALCDLTDNLWLNLSDGTLLCGRKYFDGSGGNGHALEYFERTGFPLVVKLGTISGGDATGGSGGVTADVFSYAEDDLVLDPLLGEHLAHFGIDVARMRKTDKAMSELELEANHRLMREMHRMTEEETTAASSSSGAAAAAKKRAALEAVPGHLGLTNLGNTCYMNSVLQVWFRMAGMREHLLCMRRGSANQNSSSDNQSEKLWNSLLQSTRVSDLPTNFFVQLCKLGRALYNLDDAEAGGIACLPDSWKAGDVIGPLSLKRTGICPQLFRNLIGRDHTEFRTNRQQDAFEFFNYLVEQFERNWKRRANTANSSGGSELDYLALISGQSGAPPPTNAFRVRIQDRISPLDLPNHVSYATRTDTALSLPVPLPKKDPKNDAQNSTTRTHPVFVRLADCVTQYAQPETVEQFRVAGSSALCTALKRTGLLNFPPHIWIQLRKFYVDENDWLPKKLDVEIELEAAASDTLSTPPEIEDATAIKKNTTDYVIDLACLRVPEGVQSGETLMAEADVAGQSALTEAVTFVFDAEAVTQLMGMGFSETACKNALYETRSAIGGGGVDMEAATNWILSRFENPAELETPLFPQPNAAASVNQNQQLQKQAAAQPSEESLTMLMEIAGLTRDQAAFVLRKTDGQLERAADFAFSHIDELDALIGQENLKQEEGTSATSQSNATTTTLDDPARSKYRLRAFISHSGGSAACGHYVCHIKRPEDGAWIIFNDEKVALSENPPISLAYIYLFEQI